MDHQATWLRTLTFVNDLSASAASERIWAKSFLIKIIPAGADLRGRLAIARARLD